MSDTQPPLDFFLTSSATGLQSFELSRMNRAANLRKELRQVMEEWIQAEVNARFARWVLESRRPQALACCVDLLTAAAAAGSKPVEQLSISFLPAHEGPSAPLPVPELLPHPLPSSEEIPSGARIAAPVFTLARDAAAEAATAPIARSLLSGKYFDDPVGNTEGEDASAIDDSQSVKSIREPDAVARAKSANICEKTTQEGSACDSHARLAADIRSPRGATAKGEPAIPASLHEPGCESAPELTCEPASALDRCAQQSVAVLHNLGRAPSHFGNGSHSCRPRRQKPAPLPARAFGSRACVDAVA